MTAHTGSASSIVAAAVAQLGQVLANNNGKRDLMDSLGLNAVWDEIKNLGFGVVAQFAQIAGQFLMTGTQAWEKAKVILAQLQSDLLSHTGNAATIVNQAISQLNGVLSNQGRRDLAEIIGNQLGLGAVWSQLQVNLTFLFFS